MGRTLLSRKVCKVCIVLALDINVCDSMRFPTTLPGQVRAPRSSAKSTLAPRRERTSPSSARRLRSRW